MYNSILAGKRIRNTNKKLNLTNEQRQQQHQIFQNVRLSI